MEKSIQGVVDISAKLVVERRAIATGLVHLSESSKDAITTGSVKKGDVLEASTIAAIQAVKETPRIIPHCHQIPLEGCKVVWTWEGNSLRCTVEVNALQNWNRNGSTNRSLSRPLCALDMVKSLEKMLMDNIQNQSQT